VRNKDRFSQLPITQDNSPPLKSIQGEPIKQYGGQCLPFGFESGRKLSMKTAASDAHQTVMSVAAGLDAGLTYVFSPQGCFLTKSHVPTPSDKESMVRIDDHVYIKGRI
jgi:hypothetical protein